MTRQFTVLAAAAFITITAGASAQTPDPLVNNARLQFATVSGFIARSAEKIPENLYAFHATPEVRSIGQTFGHIADAYFEMCSTAKGEAPPRTGIERSVTAKADLVKALGEGVAYCQSVIAGMNETKSKEPVQFYFGPTPRLSVLYFVTTHSYEHYGNLVTYMRLNRIVPPSSEPAR